jgi:hypothetical protein
MSAAPVTLRRGVVAVVLALVGALVGCGGLQFPQKNLGDCHTDQDCPDSQVCLDRACSAAGNLVLQVKPAGGVPPQEFLATGDGDGGLNLALATSGGLIITTAVSPLKIDLTGHSLLLPDQARTVPSFPGKKQGDTLPVGAGNYTLLATPQDGITPPTQVPATLLDPGLVAAVPLNFAKLDDLEQVTGQLQADALFATPATDFAFAVQAFSAGPAVSPLSQQVRVSAHGDPHGLTFDLWVPRQPASTPVTLVVTPTMGPGPQASFNLTYKDLEAPKVVMPLGDALALSPLSGQVLDPDGKPVAGAQVQFIGLLPGDETFHAAPERTDAQGRFTATVLHAPGASESYHALIVPPATSDLAMAQWPPATDPTGLLLGQLTQATALDAPITLARAPVVTGRVLDPQGKPVSRATVHASPVRELSALPLLDVYATTSDDGTGSFSMQLTAGTYHVDYQPPLVLSALAGSRLFVVSERKAQTLPDLALGASHTVSGTASQGNQAASGAAVLLYRAAPPSADPSLPARSTLLSQGLVGTDGTFSLEFPSR